MNRFKRGLRTVMSLILAMNLCLSSTVGYAAEGSSGPNAGVNNAEVITAKEPGDDASAQGEVKSGTYTASDGQVYAVLYTDYIAVYVNKDNGGYAIVPASEGFDGSQPLSYAMFRIDGQEYRYGSYYEGVTGEAALAPEVDEAGLLESHQVIGDYAISQYFAIAREGEHDNSYAVKVGYAAEYFGEGESSIGGRILLNTRFSPGEALPLLLTDSAGSQVLLHSEAMVSPAPTSASVNEELVKKDASGNNIAGSGVDLENAAKGYILFEDSASVMPNHVVFADVTKVSGYNYTPSAEIPLFDGAVTDSAALLYWNDRTLSQGTVAFATNYGFSDLQKGSLTLDTSVKRTRSLLRAQAGDSSAAVYVDNDENRVPGAWFEITSSLALSEGTDSYDNPTLVGQADSSMEDIIFSLVYKDDTPEVIRKAVSQYYVYAYWVRDPDENGENDIWKPVASTSGNEEEPDPINVGEDFTLSGAFDTYEDGCYLSIGLEPIIGEAEGYVRTDLAPSGDSTQVSLSLSGENEDDAQFYVREYNNHIYFAKKGATVTLRAELSDTTKTINPSQSGYYWTSWEDNAALPAPLQNGPRVFTYEFTVPMDATEGYLTTNIIDATSVTSPINVKAYDGNGRNTTIEDALMSKVTATSKSDGLIWGATNDMVTVDVSELQSTNYTITLYDAVSNSPLDIIDIGEIAYNSSFGYEDTSGGTVSTFSFAMPDRAVSIVYMETPLPLVFKEVVTKKNADGITPDDGTASVTLSPETPKVNDDVYVYVNNVQEGYKVASVTGSGSVSPALQPGGAWLFKMPSADVTLTVTLEKEPEEVPIPMHGIEVLPLVSDGFTLYDVMFWTDDVGGARKPYQVDEAGRIGQIAEGTTVHYVLYPTTWDTTENSATDMSAWTVDGFYIRGVSDTNQMTDSGFSSPGYFPTTYNPDEANATSGTFTMPQNDVTFEIVGYPNAKDYSMTLEVYDYRGNQLTLPDKSVRSGSVSAIDANAGNAPATWTEGLTATSTMGEYICFELPENYDDYTFEKLELVDTDAEGRTYKVDADITFFDKGNVLRYYFQPQYSRTVVARVTYTGSDIKTVKFTGYEVTTDWNVFKVGEVRVNASSSSPNETSLLTDNTLKIRKGSDGRYVSFVTLDWGTDYANIGNIFTLPAGTGYSVDRIELERSRITYKLTMSENAASNTTIAIGTENVAPNLNFGGAAYPNTPNNASFRNISLTTKSSNQYISLNNNFKEILESDEPPVITKVEMKSKSGLTNFSKTVTDSEKILAAIEFPDSFGAYIMEEGQVAQLDLRKLFDLSDDYVFPVKILPDLKEEYTITIEWEYGYQLREKGSSTYTFELGMQLFARNEIKAIGVVPTEAASGIYYQTVAGKDVQDMVNNAIKIYNKAPLLTFVSEFGFNENDDNAQGPDGRIYKYYTDANEVVLNGHAYFKTLFGLGQFYISEDNGTVRIKSIDRSIGSSLVPIWLPVQVGSGGNWQAGSDTLDITLQRGKTYTIPDEVPEYHKDGYASAEEALEAWKAEVDELLANTVTIKPGDTGVDLGIKVGEYQINGIKAMVDNISLLGHGFNAGGTVSITIPGMSKPLMRAAIVMLTTDNTAKLIPIDNVWAEGEATVQLPDWIGGFGGYGEAVFNTYTQDMGLEGEANYMVLMLAGSFYLARSERLNIPFLDSFEVAFEADALAAGLGIPPAPAQVLEIQGVSAGINDLTDFIDYNPFVDTIPSVELTFSASFRLVEVINFQAQVWVQLLSGKINVTGGVGLGPIQIEVLKELSFSLGVQDGPFETYDEADQNFFVKGKRSLLFFVNAKFHASLMGIVHGAGGFGISMTVSPALWEKQGGFDSVNELVQFLAFNVSANGYLMASINFPMTDFQIMDADVILDIVFEPGADLDFAPLGFKKFKFEATERVLGIKVSESSFDLLAMYPMLKYWVQQQVAAAKEKLNDLRENVEENLQASVQEATVQALNTFLAAPEATGLEPDPNYKGETKLLSFGETVADSSERTETGGETIVQSRNGAMTRGVMRMAIAQDNTNIRVESDGKTYSHRITVPNDTNDYILQLEDYGDSDNLAFADISVVKPNGQALTIREVAKNVTAEQADSGYNAAIVDGVLILRLSDYGNTTDGLDITTDYTTLSGEWQVTSPKAFKSKLVKITPEAGVTSVNMNGNRVEAVFENLDQGLDGGESYYYDIVLERKSSPDEAPIETFPLVKNEKLENSTMSFDLAQEDLELSDKLPTGDWYPHVTLRKGKVEAYEMNDENASTLITEYVVDKVSDTVYKNVNTALNGVTWDAEFTAAAAGNQSIALTWNKATGTDPDSTIEGDLGMGVRGYYIAVYDAATGALASRTVTGEDGSQSVKMMEYSVQPEEQVTYSYSLADIPIGSYKVGITPLYADWVETLEPSDDDPDIKVKKKTLSPVSRRGSEKMSATMTIAQATPPTLSLQLTGTGNIDESSGYTMIFAGTDAELVTSASDGATVSIMEYDGTPVVFSETNTLADYAGETLMIQAENAAKDTTTMIASVYAAPNAPLLLPDNYVTLSDDEDEAGERGEFLFIADYTTGAYEITGQTEPGQPINGAVSDDNGRFTISGTLAEGTDEEFVTLVVTNIAGMVTMREVRIERGPDTGSDEDITAALEAVEEAEYTTTQAATADKTAAQTYVESVVEALSAITDKSVIPTYVWGDYTAPIAGTVEDLDGTDGRLPFIVTLNKGGGSTQRTTSLYLTITAEAYNPAQDNADITAAKTAVEGTDYTTTQSAAESATAAQTYVEGVVEALSAITDKSVIPTYAWGDYTAPIAGTVEDLDGTDGSLSFTVTLNKGAGTEQTTKDLTLTITATPYDTTPDNTDITSAKEAVESASYATTQSTVATETAAKTYVTELIGALSAIKDKSVIPTYAWGDFTAPIAGTASDKDGTGGSLTFTVTLNKGGGTAQTTKNLTLTITANPYDSTKDNADIAAAKGIVEGATYTTSQSATATKEAAQTYVESVVEGMSEIDDEVTATYTWGTYTAPITGIVGNLDGTEGSLTFTVTLNKGGGTAQTTKDLTLTITATPYDTTPDNTDISSAKEAVESTSYTITQSTVATETAAKTYVTELIEALSAIKDKSVIPTCAWGDYTAPIAGTASDHDGTSGSLLFTVTLNKGGGLTQTSSSLTLTIIAIPYGGVEDDADITTAKGLVEGATYTTTQATTATEEAAQTYVESVVEGLTEIDDEVTASYTWGTYTAPVTGIVGSLDGTNGSLTFTVTLSKGGGTAQTTKDLTLTITATPYDVTPDNTDITSAKEAVESASYTTTQSATATKEAAQTYVESVVEGLSEIDAGVTATYTWGTYTAPVTGIVGNLYGTDGSLTFTVTLNKGGGTAQTTKNLTLTITATPYDATPDNTDISAAKGIVEGATYTTSQSTTSTEIAAKTYVTNLIGAISAVKDNNVIPTYGWGDYTAPTEGTAEDQGGTNGSLTFTVTLRKGGGLAQTTKDLTLTITATPYDATQDNADITAAKGIVEGATYTTTQSATATKEAAQTYVESVVEGMSEIDAGVTATYTWGTYTAPVLGIVGNLDGTDGSLTFTVTLNKGGGTAQTTKSLTLTITATSYDTTPDNTDISSAKETVESASYTTTQSAVATETAAKTYVTELIGALSAIKDKSVIPTYAWEDYTAPIAGTASDHDGTSGGLLFTVTLNKGGGTAQTTRSLTLTITAIPYGGAGDDADITTAKGLVEGATYTTSQSATATKEAAQTYVESVVEGLTAIDDEVTATYTWGTYTAPVTGIVGNLAGTDGSLTFTVTLNKGGGTTQTTKNLTLTITATPYDATPDNTDISAAKGIVEGATYTTSQSATATKEAAQTYVESVVEGLTEIDDEVTATYTWGTYTAPVTGIVGNLDGTDGSLTFTVTLNKGGGTAQTTKSLTLTIIATPYDATPDNTDITSAKEAVESASYTTTQSATATKEAAQTYVEGVVEALSAIKDEGVNPSYVWGDYIAPIAGTVEDLDGTDGSLSFTVTLNKGAGTEQTTKDLTLTITATSYDVTPDNTDITSAKEAVESASYTTTQSATATKEAAQTYVESVVEGLTEIDAEVTATYNWGTYTAPVTGIVGSLDGTDGSLTFTVTLNKGGGTAQTTKSLTLTIIATPYDVTPDNTDITSAKEAVESASYTTTQSATATKAAAQTYVESVVEGLTEIDAEVTATYTWGTYTAPVTGIVGNLAGTDGSLTFTVTLNKGGGTAQTTKSLTLTITATPYDVTPDNTDITSAKEAVESASYTTTQSATATKEAAQTYVESVVEGLTEIDAGVTATYTWETYTAPITGIVGNLDGTNGNLTFTVTLNKGGGLAQTTKDLTLTITATPYDVTPDNTDITSAKEAVESASFTTTQSTVATETAAKTYVTDIIGALSAIKDKSVIPTCDWEDYTAPIAGTASDHDGTSGSLLFTVTLNKGGGTAQTTRSLTLTITAIPYGGAGDDADITTAKGLVEGATYTTTQATTATKEAAQTYVESVVEGLTEIDDEVTTTYTWGRYTAPITGIVGNLDGTNGSLTFTVTLNKGSGTAKTTKDLTLTITATSYQPPAIAANDGSVQVNYIGEGSEIQLLLPDDKIQELLNRAKDNHIIFNLSANDEISQVSMPESAIQEFLDAGMGIEMELAAGYITLSNEALSTLTGNGTEVTFQAEQKQIASLSTAQQAAIAPDDIIFDIAVLLDNQSVHLFNGEITLALPYAGATPASAWYLSDNGQLEKMYGTYDEVNQLFYFTPPHLSIYLVGPEESNDDGIRLSNIYIPTTEKGAEILSAKVAVYEDGILSDGSAARLYLTGITSQVKAQAEKDAISRGLQPPFAMAAVHGVGVAAGKAMTVSFNLINIVAGDKITVLQLLQDGTWEALEPIQVGNGTVKVTIKTDSVVAFARTSKNSIPRSPNSGDMNNWIQWAIVLLLLITGSILTALGVNQINRKKHKSH